MKKVNNPLLHPLVTVQKFSEPFHLGIFAKAPQSGRVKTRLSPPLTPDECAEFHRFSFCDTVAAMERFAPVVFWSGAEDFFRHRAPGLRRCAQGEGDLGARMARALTHLLKGGTNRALLIGSDSPDLPASMVAAAAAALEDADVAAIPARDGGYVAIGVRGEVPAQLFAAMPWSTGEVLALTRRRCAESGLVWQEVGGWEDVDDWADLRRLVERSPQLTASRYAAGLLARYVAG